MTTQLVIEDIPGDKSISHRAIICGALADNVSQFTNFLTAEDCLNTLSIFQQLGVSIERDGTRVTVHGVGASGFKVPDGQLDVGNSGTGIRLITGILAGLPFDTCISGDHSIEGRPMKRIIDPLSTMGAEIQGQQLEGKTDIYPPLTIKGKGQLSATAYTLPVASAQVKSAVLLASLFSSDVTTVTEPAFCRDHTERFLKGYGADIHVDEHVIACSGKQTLHNPSDDVIHIPSDISSAAFFIVLALLLPDTEVTLKGIGINPTRDAVLTALHLMGADIALLNKQGEQFEPYADIVVRSSSLQGIELPESLVPILIDEIPILAVAALFAKGTFKVTGAKELRVKESDRIKSIVHIVEAFGGQIREFEDGFEMEGGSVSHEVSIQSRGDHRIAMSALVAAKVMGVSVSIDDTACINTSFPSFFDIFHRF